MAVVNHAGLFEEAADGLLAHDPETGEVMAVNESYCDLLGYERSDLLGADLSTLAGDRPYATADGADPVERAREAGSVRFDWTNETSAGERVPVEVRVTLTDHGGTEVALSSVRERPESDGEPSASGAVEEDTAAIRERYRALFETGQIVLWEFDLSAAKRGVDALAERVDGDLVDHLEANPAALDRLLDRVEIRDINDAAVEFYGADSERELRDRFGEMLTADALATWRRLFARIAEGATTFQSECESRTLDGREKITLLRMTVPERHADDYARVYIPCLDITERKRRERELERKNEFLDEFANVVSHDIATPLGVIENKARLVEMTGDTSHAADIFEATERIHDLVDRLRDLARQGDRIGETESVDLGTVAREAWGSVETADASLTVEGSTVVEASPDRLRQLLENLLRNAVEHGPTGDDGGVAIRVGTAPDGFYVADDGPGIPAAERVRVFEQGYTTDADSTGLGLAIVRRIAEAHGWSVRATESEAGGARFEIGCSSQPSPEDGRQEDAAEDDRQ